MPQKTFCAWGDEFVPRKNMLCFGRQICASKDYVGIFFVISHYVLCL